MGCLSMSLRIIPLKLPTIDQLGLPPAIEYFANLPQGLVLVTGPTGSGKSTTLAAMINYINERRRGHILTIEDPVEYVHPHKNSAVSQREVGSDTHSFARALRAALREDPDVILVGEMRDPETVQFALSIAETGHLVFATLHTNDAPQALDRISDMFPAERQNQIKVQLAACLSGVVSQRLLPRIGGGMMLFLIALDMVFAREEKTTPAEKAETRRRADISVFPLAFPLISGPGSIATVLLTFGAARPEVLLYAGLIAVIALVVGMSLLVMLAAPVVMRVLGVTGANVVSRVAGVVLAALAVQFVIDGLKGAFELA